MPGPMDLLKDDSEEKADAATYLIHQINAKKKEGHVTKV